MSRDEPRGEDSRGELKTPGPAVIAPPAPTFPSHQLAYFTEQP